jgi:hypothetical protein
MRRLQFGCRDRGSARPPSVAQSLLQSSVQTYSQGRILWCQGGEESRLDGDIKMRRISLNTIQTENEKPRESEYLDFYLSRLVVQWRERLGGRAVLTLKAGETFLGVVDNDRGSYLFIGQEVLERFHAAKIQMPDNPLEGFY